MSKVSSRDESNPQRICMIMFHAVIKLFNTIYDRVRFSNCNLENHDKLENSSFARIYLSIFLPICPVEFRVHTAHRLGFHRSTTVS